MLIWRLSSSRMASSRVFSVSLRERLRLQEADWGGTTSRSVEVGVSPGVMMRRMASELRDREMSDGLYSLQHREEIETEMKLSSYCAGNDIPCIHIYKYMNM